MYRYKENDNYVVFHEKLTRKPSIGLLMIVAGTLLMRKS